MSHWRWSREGPSHPMSLGMPILPWSRHETHSRKTQSFDNGPQTLDRANGAKPWNSAVNEHVHGNDLQSITCGPVRLNWWGSWIWLDVERH